jgi:hypothetical protein
MLYPIFCFFSLFERRPRPQIIKHYGLVNYRKWTDLIVSLCLFYCQSLSLDWTNTLACTHIIAYYGIRTL